ncbi:MAG: hypothetical protein ABF242_00150 [Flavobacteriales bacterium]
MKYFNKIIAVVFLLATQLSGNAQCAMCKATAESNPDVGGGLNAGIEYIMFFPYLMLVGFAVLLFRGRLVTFWRDLTGKDKGENDVYSAKDWY